MTSMVASHRGTARFASRLLALGVCLGFHASQARAQDEGNPTPASKEPMASEPVPVETPKAEPDAGAEQNQGDKIKDRIKDFKKNRQKTRKETTDAVIKRRGRDPETARYVMLGEAQTLPEKVVRFRFVHRTVDGNMSFEEDGVKRDIGIDALVKVNAYALEYGVTDRLSLQLLVPTIASNDVTMNATKFSKSKIYAREYQKVMDKVVPFLMGQNVCSSEAECLDKINGGYKLPTATNLMLPTGEVYTVGAESRVERIANALITGAVKPHKGKTGVSDIMVAALYNVYNSKSQMISLGAGFRLPTGEGDDEKSFNRTGSGFTTLGFALKYDFRLADPLMLSFSNQTEVHVKNAHWKRHSLVDADKLNEADPNASGSESSPEIPGAGDGISNNYEVSRKVPLNTGYLRLGYALGALHPMLSTLSVLGYYNWHSDPETFYDGQAQFDSTLSTGYSYAISFDGLGMNPRIPVALSASQDRVLTGKNVTVAAVSTSLGLTLYYKF